MAGAAVPSVAPGAPPGNAGSDTGACSVRTNYHAARSYKKTNFDIRIAW